MPGTTTQNIVVSLIGDGTIEGNEAFTVALSNETNAGVTTRTATGTINDDDGALQVSVDDAAASEAAGTVGVTIRLNTVSATAVTVDYATAFGTATSADFTAASGTATIAAGQTSATIPITLANDALDEDDETFTVTLSNPSTGTISDGQSQITIQDDDATPSLSVADVTVSESAANATFTVTLGAASGRTVTAQFATSDGSATAGSDYADATGQVTFAPGVITQTVNVPLSDDAIIEGSETFTLTLTAPVNATLTDATATATLTDDDGALQVSVDDAAASESAGTVGVTIRLNTVSATAVTVDYATAFGTATAGDFTSTSGTATIAAGQTTTTVSITLASDALDEDDETFTVALSNPVERHDLGWNGDDHHPGRRRRACRQHCRCSGRRRERHPRVYRHPRRTFSQTDYRRLRYG